MGVQRMGGGTWGKATQRRAESLERDLKWATKKRNVEEVKWSGKERQ